MSIADYIRHRFSSFGISLSEADLFDITKGEEGEMDSAHFDRVMVAIAEFIPSLLLRPSVSESGFSMSWDRQGIRDYYSYLCSRYGLKNRLETNKPKVTFL